MELKRSLELRNSLTVLVLIVPSGIETQDVLLSNYPHQVLIVPSGIETGELLLVEQSEWVLIVPSGIETPIIQPSTRRFRMY